MGVMRRAGNTIASCTWRMEKTAGVWEQSSNRRKASPDARWDLLEGRTIAELVMSLAANGFDGANELITGEWLGDVGIRTLF